MKTLLLAFLSLLLLVPAARGQEEDMEKKLKAGDRDREFLLRVNTAVRKGMDSLLSMQKQDGSFSCWCSDEFQGGATALALLALLKSGVPRSHEAIKKGFARLKQLPPQKTYVVSFIIMALEARWTKQEVEKRQEGLTKAVQRRPRMPRQDFEWMRELVRFLLANITYGSDLRDASTGEHLGPKNSWRYPGPAEVGDHSNTQYALLALRSAARCGIPIPPDVWERVFDHFIETQEKDGPKVVRMKMLEDDEHGYVSYKPLTGVPDHARGWCYSTSKKPVWQGAEDEATTGSMTSVGVASLLITMEGLKRHRKLGGKRMRDGRQAAFDGLAWLTHHFSVEKNPGHPNDRWQYYYLYGLERACVLAGVRNLGTHDWYREGAEWLMNNQKNGGTWTFKSPGGDPLVGTSFALLFLTKATVPGLVKITH